MHGSNKIRNDDEYLLSREISERPATFIQVGAIARSVNPLNSSSSYD